MDSTTNRAYRIIGLYAKFAHIGSKTCSSYLQTTLPRRAGLKQWYRVSPESADTVRAPDRSENASLDISKPKGLFDAAFEDGIKD